MPPTGGDRFRCASPLAPRWYRPLRPHQRRARVLCAGRGIVGDMETTTPSSPTEPAPQPKGLVARLLADRHSLPLSIALHLVPGALIVAVYLLFAEPLVTSVGYPAFLAWAVALSVVLYPLLLGLMWLGRKRTGRFSLKGVLRYTDRPLSRGKVAAFGIPAFLWMFVLALGLVPLDTFFVENLFSWVPWAEMGGDLASPLDGYSHSTILITMLIGLPLTATSLPLVEEIYFRGFLMPRLAHLGGWAPVLSTVLFSVYHFWSPWGIVSRIIFFIPGPWLVWKHNDIRLSIVMHVGNTTFLGVAAVIAIAAGVI